MVCSKDTAKDEGLNIWVDAEPDGNGAEVDVVAVQGLGAHKYYTWVRTKRSPTQQDESRRFAFFPRRRGYDSVEVMWLRDLLPLYLFNARIATYSYKSDWRQDVKTNIRTCGEQLLNVLYQHRSSEKEACRPLILIGHSLGGLVIKQALVLANHNTAFKDLRLSVAGIIFLGTPHQGCDTAVYGKLLAQATGRDTTLLRALIRNSQTLQEIAQDFETSYGNTNLVCYYEKNDGPLGVKFVDYESACLVGKRSMYLTTDHSGLNKFSGSEDKNFTLVLREIQRMAQEAQQLIESRFEFQASATVPSLTSFRVNFSLKGVPVLHSFVERDVEMARLAEMMLPSSTNKARRKICVLHGLGGIGKTQLAIEFARKYQKEYSAVFWIDGSSKEKLKQNIANLAKQLPRHQLLHRARLYARKPPKDLDGAVEDVLSWFSQSSNEQWLLIYDNVDPEFSAEKSDFEAFKLEDYLPEADQGFILITSRLTSLLNLGGANIRVGPVSNLQGENILANSIGETMRDSKELISLLQGLPLAINQAGTYIRTTGISVLGYIKLYHEAWKNLMESQHQFASQGSLDCSVLTTWTLLFRRLEERNGHAAKLLLLWGFLDNRDIWYGLFKSALTQKVVASKLPVWYTKCVNDYSSFVKCTQLFVLYSFIDVKIGSSSFSVHPVLHQWCFQASEDNMGEMAWLASVLVASSAPHSTMTDHTLIQRRLLPHCDRVSLLIRGSVPKTPTYEKESSLDIACSTLGYLYRNLGKLREAEDMYMRALVGKEKALGPEHISTLDTVNNLGLLYGDQGRLREAEDMYVRALVGYEKALGPEHTATLDTVNNLGTLYRYQGRLREAEDMYERALTGREKALGPKHHSTLWTVNNLGLLFADQGKLGEAEDMYMRALLGKKDLFGLGHTRTLGTVNNIGVLYVDQGKLKEAEEMFVRALVGREKAFGPEHASTLDTMNNLGLLYRYQGKLREAEEMYDRALAGREKALGYAHISTMDTTNNLGALYAHQGNLRRAEFMFKEALHYRELTLGPEHTSTLVTVNNLAQLYADQERLDEAEYMYVRALVGKRKAFGPEHTSTLITANNLATLYTNQGKFREAEDMLRRALVGLKKNLGPKHETCVGVEKNIFNAMLAEEKQQESQRKGYSVQYR